VPPSHFDFLFLHGTHADGTHLRLLALGSASSPPELELLAVVVRAMPALRAACVCVVCRCVDLDLSGLDLAPRRIT
jgi:hypothetical protein